MTTSKFITNLNLTLLSDINLSHLENSWWKFITDSDSKLATLQLSIELLILADIVHDQALNQSIGMFILCPTIRLYAIILQVLQSCCCELATLGDDLSTRVILHALRSLAFSQGEQLINQNILQVVALCLVLLINLGKDNLILLLWLTSLNGTREQLLVDNNTTQWWVSLQWRILHITSLITEDGTEQLLFWRRIALTLRWNLTNHDIAWLDTSTNANNTVIIKILGSFLADIRNIRSELLNTTLGLTYIQWILIYVNRCQNIIANHTLWDNDSILIVVTLPRNVSYEQVTAQSQLTILGSITLCQDITLLDTLTLVTDRTQVDGHILVGTTELRNAVLLQGRLEAYELIILRTIVEDTDGCSIYILDNTLTLCSNHGTRILAHLLLKTSTYDRCIIVKQWNCLAHHVTSHQCTVTIIMLQEWNQTCWNRCNLLWRNIHIVNLWRWNNWIISILTALNHVADKCTIFCQRSITLTDDLSLLILSCQVNNIIIVHINLAIVHLTVRSYDKAEVIDLCIHTEWRNQTDVWTFRTLNRTKTTIVSIVYVSNLETSTLTRQTTRTKGRKTTLVGYLSQWVSLVHELWQWVGTKEWVDNARDGLGIDQICWSEHLIVAYIHTLTDSAAHTCQTDRELVSQLLAYGTNTTVRQVVDIIDSSTWVDELNQIFDNLDDVILSQNADINISIET